MQNNTLPPTLLCRKKRITTAITCQLNVILDLDPVFVQQIFFPCLSTPFPAAPFMSPILHLTALTCFILPLGTPIILPLTSLTFYSFTRRPSSLPILHLTPLTSLILPLDAHNLNSDAPDVPYILLPQGEKLAKELGRLLAHAYVPPRMT